MRISLVLLLFFGMTSACTMQPNNEVPTIKVKETEALPSPTRGMSHAYYFEMKAEDLAKLAKEVKKLNLGDSLDYVQKQLGKPDKGPSGIGKADPSVNVKKTMEYQVKKWEKGLINIIHDKGVIFDFDDADRLIFISSNVDGIETRGSPLKTN